MNCSELNLNATLTAGKRTVNNGAEVTEWTP